MRSVQLAKNERAYEPIIHFHNSYLYLFNSNFWQNSLLPRSIFPIVTKLISKPNSCFISALIILGLSVVHKAMSKSCCIVVARWRHICLIARISPVYWNLCTHLSMVLLPLDKAIAISLISKPLQENKLLNFFQPLLMAVHCTNQCYLKTPFV